MRLERGGHYSFAKNFEEKYTCIVLSCMQVLAFPFLMRGTFISIYKHYKNDKVDHYLNIKKTLSARYE